MLLHIFLRHLNVLLLLETRWIYDNTILLVTWVSDTAFQGRTISALLPGSAALREGRTVSALLFG